jgi:hypothetical protein
MLGTKFGANSSSGHLSLSSLISIVRPPGNEIFRFTFDSLAYFISAS